MKKLCLMAAMCAGLLARPAYPAELGRRDVSSRSGGGGIETTKGYSDFLAEGVFGLDVSAVWNHARWDASGSTESATDSGWTPQLSAFYGMNRFLDVRLCYEPLSLDDGQANLDITRVGVGVRARKSGADFIPFVEALVNYYVLSSDNVEDLDGAFGVSAEAGVSYQVSDFFLINLGITGETFLNEPSATDPTSGEDVRVSFDSFGVLVGVTVLL